MKSREGGESAGPGVQTMGHLRARQTWAWVGGWGWWNPYIEQNPNGAGQVLSQYWYDASKKV